MDWIKALGSRCGYPRNWGLVMPVKQPNYDRVQHASVRVKVDPFYWAIQQDLDEAWYGDKDENGRSDRTTGAKVGVQGRMWSGMEIASLIDPG